jgi:Pyruvate/2-oxoacid:ferredoxin oxidoreductase delta subunit
MIREFFTDPEDPGKFMETAQELDKVPKFVRDGFVYLITRERKQVHYGQVIPIEDVARILKLTNSIVRVACYCRYSILGKEKRYCYGISLSPESNVAEIVAGLDKSFLTGPETAGMERLTREQALEAFRAHEREGLCHTVWTFQTPFIGGICNCDRSDCWAMRYTMSRNIPLMFRAEYVGQINADACNGCRQCIRQCQFGALTWSASEKKAVIDQRWCYGCGICRAVCQQKAIKLVSRAKCPAAANLW